MASLNMFKSIRSACQSKEGFDEHTTRRHSVSDPLADQYKGAWFCVKEGLLRPKDNSIEAPECYTLDNSGKPSGKVDVVLLLFNIDVEEKGYEKVNDNFKTKLYELFPDLRFELLI